MKAKQRFSFFRLHYKHSLSKMKLVRPLSIHFFIHFLQLFTPIRNRITCLKNECGYVNPKYAKLQFNYSFNCSVRLCQSQLGGRLPSGNCSRNLWRRNVSKREDRKMGNQRTNDKQTISSKERWKFIICRINVLSKLETKSESPKQPFMKESGIQMETTNE